MKRLVSYVCILCICVMILSACGKSDAIENGNYAENSVEESLKKSESGNGKKTEDNEDLPTLEKTYKNWADGYKRIIEDNAEHSEFSYDFLYINDDDIPEMVMEIPGAYYVIYTSYKIDDADEYRIVEGAFPVNISGILGYRYIKNSAIRLDQNGASTGEDKEYFRYIIISNGEFVEAYNITFYNDDSGTYDIVYSSIYEELSEEEIEARINELEKRDWEYLSGSMGSAVAIGHLETDFGAVGDSDFNEDSN